MFDKTSIRFGEFNKQNMRKGETFWFLFSNINIIIICKTVATWVNKWNILEHDQIHRTNKQTKNPVNIVSQWNVLLRFYLELRKYWKNIYYNKNNEYAQYVRRRKNIISLTNIRKKLDINCNALFNWAILLMGILCLYDSIFILNLLHTLYLLSFLLGLMDNLVVRKGFYPLQSKCV